MVTPNGTAGYLAIGSFAAAYYFFARGTAQEIAWCGFLNAWCLSLVDALFGIIGSFCIINNIAPKADEMLPTYEAVLSGIVLPGLLTIPIVCLVLTQGGKPLSRMSCWLIVAVMLAFVDVLLIALSTVSVMGVRFMRDGTVDWTFGPH